MDKIGDTRCSQGEEEEKYQWVEQFSAIIKKFKEEIGVMNVSFNIFIVFTFSTSLKLKACSSSVNDAGDGVEGQSVWLQVLERTKARDSQDDHE